MEEIKASTVHPAPRVVACISAGWTSALAAIRQNAMRSRPVVCPARLHLLAAGTVHCICLLSVREYGHRPKARLLRCHLLVRTTTIRPDLVLVKAPWRRPHLKSTPSFLVS